MRIQTILIALISFTLSGCGKKRFSMPASDMEPTIPKGSEIVADMRAYRTEEPQRFDLVVFTPPESASQYTGVDYSKFIFCKRVIGLPKEKIEIKENGVFIDSKKITIPEELHYQEKEGKTEAFELKSNEYFLLGDNTENSFDSRYWGPVDRSLIYGKVIKIQPE